MKFNPNQFNGTKEFVSDASSGSKAFKISSGNAEEYNDGYYYQRISCSYEGFKYHFAIDAKLVGASDTAEILIWQRNKAGMGNVGQQHLVIDSTTYKTYEADITMNENAGNLDIFLHVENGSAIFDNAKLYRVLD